MYNVSLVNLAADGRSAADALGQSERPGLADAEMRELLRAFCEIDAVQNAVAEPEIRVKVREERYLIRTGQKKLMLYDATRRELPALVLGVDEVMAELDGSGPDARNLAYAPPVGAAPDGPAALLPPAQPVVAARPLRLITLGTVALALLGAILYPHWGRAKTAAPPSYQPVAAAESAELQAALTGVYLTGNQPGHHGIVFIAAGDLKLFELSALEAPRVVYATAELGRIGPQLVLATDQPGGLIEVAGRDTLVYCGEVYRRVP
jgi:hypothetical protein